MFNPAAKDSWKKQRVAFMAAGAIAIGIVVIIIFGAFLQLLWNVLMTPLFGLPAIGFWQAIGLFLLAKLFFGFGIGGGGGPRRRGSRSHRKSSAASAGDAAPGNVVDTEVDKTFVDERFQQYWQSEGRAAWESFVAKD